MIVYLFKRLFFALPTLFALMTLAFLVMRMVPGGPFDGEKALPPEVKANLAAKYQLDKPLLSQYASYLSGVVRGDLGPSYRYLDAQGVNQIIAQTLPVSAQLGFLSLLWAILLGLPLGVFAAYYKDKIIDRLIMSFCVSAISLPNFLLASFLILFFSFYLEILPPALWEDWRSTILPAIALSLRPMALIARLMRASILDTLSSDYIRTAYAKGLPTFKVLFKHALKNALIPVVTLLGPIVAAVITGSFVIEVIFAIPGMGKHFVGAVIDRDYPLIMGVTLVYGVIVIASNLIVDLVYALIDPRIKVGETQ